MNETWPNDRQTPPGSFEKKPKTKIALYHALCVLLCSEAQDVVGTWMQATASKTQKRCVRLWSRVVCSTLPRLYYDLCSSPCERSNSELTLLNIGFVNVPLWPENLTAEVVKDHRREPRVLYHFIPRIATHVYSSPNPPLFTLFFWQPELVKDRSMKCAQFVFCFWK